MYGESQRARDQRNRKRGLSPRVRGIRSVRVRFPHKAGSIPACTGNPSKGVEDVILEAVYPRVYGESSVVPSPQSPRTGLSPRVRGIRRQLRVFVGRRGSIPACTGNPAASAAAKAVAKVYPRVYGESEIKLVDDMLEDGLSPRVRGIRDSLGDARDGVGSIPACTGNPPHHGP